jgi:hypothetical protein
MLRPKPTEIALTIADISQTTERIAARHRAAGKARIRRGAERSRDEAIRTLRRALPLQSAMQAVVSDQEGDAIQSIGTPKVSTASIVGRIGNRRITGLGLISGSNEAGSDEGPELVVHPQRVASQPGLAFHRLRKVSLGAEREVSQLHLDGQTEYASASYTFLNPHHTANFLNAHTNMNNGRRAGIPGSPLHQSHTTSSPIMLRSVGPVQQHRFWSSRTRQQLSDGPIGRQPSSECESRDHLYRLILSLTMTTAAEQRLEPSHSTPNLGARVASLVPNFSMPMPLSVWAPTREEYLNATGASIHSPMSLRTSSHSSSAEEAVQGDLPSPLEHISQEAAAYRSRVFSASRGVTRARLAEVMRRIDLFESRRVSELASASGVAFDHEDTLLSPTFPRSPPHRNFSSMSHGMGLSTAILPVPDSPTSPYLPTTRHRRSLPTIRHVSGMSDPPLVIPPRSKLLLSNPHTLDQILTFRQSHHPFLEVGLGITSTTDLVIRFRRRLCPVLPVWQVLVKMIYTHQSVKSLWTCAPLSIRQVITHSLLSILPSHLV